MLLRAVLDRAFAERRRLPAPSAARCLALFAVETGGCGGCGVELAALGGAAWDGAACGFERASTPADADVLLVTGALTRSMAPVLERAWHAMPGPRALVAVGACAIDGGPFGETYATLGGLAGRAVSDVAVPGCPPSPDAIRAVLLTLLS
ncbi:NADH-ubiquinone oxidoreductase 20 kDa subunit [Ameyamaea chiangmaiensis NBRC 103196]|nr:NADH-quinone oxidoreductase subunit B [Ameyamaea chiangmaiensis]GBQ64996.1 NADH-ubiquinone oxidoreductase 20 kDa subunit [Ameyamaea chiangmaiensis NBRC 103196]